MPQSGFFLIRNSTNISKVVHTRYALYVITKFEKQFLNFFEDFCFRCKFFNGVFHSLILGPDGQPYVIDAYPKFGVYILFRG